MQPARRVTALAGACGIGLAVGVLAGCTGSSGGSAPNPSTSTPGPAPSTSTIKNDPTARKAVTSTGCAATSSGWKATGTATNPGTKPATYTIVISFTTKASTVLARGTTTVTVKPGATKGWTAQASFAKTKGVQCVLRGVSAS